MRPRGSDSPDWSDMFDVQGLAGQVLRNCHISDAKHAGLYSVCGLAMRLRDLFKWSQNLPPWQEQSADRVLEWIGEREILWESLLEEEYRPLSINGRRFDPFDTAGINRFLKKHHLFYGAGYAHSLKPTFFLAGIDSCKDMEGTSVWCLGREYARDLLTLPAFVQDEQVVFRREAARMFLWDHILYISESGRPALAFALEACCGLNQAEPAIIRRHLDTIADAVQPIYIRHEIGELRENKFDRELFRQMLVDFSETTVELLIRSLKDLLADTGPQGTLNYLVQEKDAVGLGFYVAFQPGLPSVLFTELRQAFQSFMQQPDWDPIMRIVDLAHDRAIEYSRQVIDFYQAGKGGRGLPWAQECIEKTMRQRGILK